MAGTWVHYSMSKAAVWRHCGWNLQYNFELFKTDSKGGQWPVSMALMEGSQRSSPHKDQLYDFCIKFLRITGIKLPLRAESSNSRNKYFLKITLLHGTEQQKIGEFEVLGDVCTVNHQLSCQIAYGRPEKLHVYIGIWSSHLLVWNSINSLRMGNVLFLGLFGAGWSPNAQQTDQNLQLSRFACSSSLHFTGSFCKLFMEDVSF